MSQLFGFVAPNSTDTAIQVVAANNDGNLLNVIGKMVYFDTKVEDSVFRAIGTVTSMKTLNTLLTPKMNGLVAEGSYTKEISKDTRESFFVTQAVFRKNELDSEWTQYGAGLPTSPPTNTSVFLVGDEVVKEMTQNVVLPAVGTFRGLDLPLPVNTPDFGGNRGAYHSGVLGKSGSGKTAGYTFVLSSYMRHEQHAIVVVDPQGQWSNENGFIFSPQQFASALGREVKIVRIAEQVRLPQDAELIGRIIKQLNAWTRLRRMGPENQDLFSQEVADRLVRGKMFDMDPREALTKVFLEIARSKSALSRVYADEKRRLAFKDELYMLAGVENEDVDKDADDYEPPTAEDLADVETQWEVFLKVFRPLLNLFSRTNLAGETRHSLDGKRGILKDIFQVRNETSKPAPYVVFDMSPNVKLHAKRELNKADVEMQMAAMLDRDSVKALILQVLFQEIKKASETAFASSGGNLNTQIVFDEAWRYAPEGKAIPEIEELAEMLEGFAFDTRKFGIGWTYILQSPSELKRGIWSQLTYIYAAYGLVGGDIKMLEERYSDLSQTDIYRGFISPAATGVYPMMIIGSISPFIFTNSPTFLNVFTDSAQFLNANHRWVNDITTRRGLPAVKPSMVDPKQTMAGRNSKISSNPTTRDYKVSKTYEISEPQTTLTEPETPATNDEYDTPF